MKILNNILLLLSILSLVLFTPSMFFSNNLSKKNNTNEVNSIDITDFIKKIEMKRIDININNFKSLISTAQSEINYELYLKENKWQN